MDQTARNEQISKFRRNITDVLLVTDVAARGLDIPYLDNVINYDFPASSKLFVHRSGRTARAGRSGLSVSLVSADDLPYCMELSLFLGRRLRFPGEIMPAECKHTPIEDPNTADPHFATIGGIPTMDTDTESFTKIFQADADVRSLWRSMQAAYSVYYKTRTSASKASVKRAKQFIENAGGALRLLSNVHSGFKDFVTEGDSERLDFVESLRAFRPTHMRKGADAISKDAMNGMIIHKGVADMRPSAKKAEESEVFDDLGDVPTEESFADVDKMLATKKRVREEVEKTKSVVSKPRLSKKARKQGLKKAESTLGKEAEKSHESGEHQSKFETDGTEKSIFERSKFRDETFFLDDQPCQDDETRQEIDKFAMDVLGDDARDQKKSKGVMRWNAQKKKYMVMNIDAQGKVIKQRNESGRMVQGKKEQTDKYAKWVSKQKLKLQQPGELEEKRAINRITAKEAQYKEQAGEDEADSDDGLTDRERKKKILAQLQSGQHGLRSKPIIPFSGEFKESQLTHKQKRLLKKHLRLAKGEQVSNGREAKEELRRPEQIVKHRKKMERKKAKENPKERGKLRAESKEWVRNRVDRKSKMRSRPTSAKQIITYRN